MTIIGDKIYSRGALVSAGHSAKGISFCSEDNFAYFNTRLRKTRHSPGFYHNMKIMMSNASEKGVCGAVSERKPVSHSDSLFMDSELEALCKMCGQSANCVPKAGELTLTVPGGWKPPTGPEEACKGATPPIPYNTAMEKCKHFKEDTRDVAHANQILFACIFDYCATGGDDDAVANLNETHKYFVTTTTTTTSTPAPPPKRQYTLLLFVSVHRFLLLLF